MSNFLKKLLFDDSESSKTIKIGEEYINSTEDLLQSSRLTQDDEIKKEMVRNEIEEEFVLNWIRDDALKDMIKKFGITQENKNFILEEMKEISISNRKIAKTICDLLSQIE